MRVIPLLQRQGIETTVLLPDEPGNALQRLQDAGIDTIQLPLGRPRFTPNPVTNLRFLTSVVSESDAIRRVIRERKIDVVLVNGLGSPQGAIAGKRERVAVVWQLLETNFPSLFRRGMMALATRTANVIMSTGMAVARIHPGAQRFGERLITFFPPVNLERFRPDREVRVIARTQLQLMPDEIAIGTVGNINYEKNHLLFVRAAAEIRRQFKRARFFIFGGVPTARTDLVGKIRRTAENMGFRIGKDFVIQDPGADVARLIQALDIFWLTSRSEGMPTSLEEAMASGLPIVSVNVGSITEAVESGVNGIVVSRGDSRAIVGQTLRLIRDPMLRARLGQQARATALACFGEEACAEKHAEAYLAALAHNEGRTIGVARTAI